MEEKFTKEIEKILNEIGIRINLKGYGYWISAIKLKQENPWIPVGQLYEKIAEKYNITTSSVERALRNAINTANKNHEIQQYFDLKYKVNNSIFLECLFRKVRGTLNERK